VPVGEEDEGPIARSVAAHLARGLQQLLDLRRRQVFASAPDQDFWFGRGGWQAARELEISAVMPLQCPGAAGLSHFGVLAPLSQLRSFSGL
jgi:hypothetical protein